MGRVIRRNVVAVRCELRSCDACVLLDPLPVGASRPLQQAQLQLAVTLGWALVLTPQLRSYCPAHTAHAHRCSCYTNPDRSHLCTVHSVEAARAIWQMSVQHPRWFLDPVASGADPACTNLN